MALRIRKRNPRVRRRLVRRGRGKRGGRRSNIPRGITTQQNQYCKVVETVNIQDVLPGLQVNNSFNLMNFSRARYMAVGFQHYRAAKCTWTYEPLYNTYQDGAGGGDTIPYIYTTMNRTGDAILPTNLASFQAMGAKPVKFNRKHVVSYVPNWTTPGQQVLAAAATGQSQGLYSLGAQACYNWIDSSSYRSQNNAVNAAGVTTEVTGQLISIQDPDLPANLQLSAGTTTTTARQASYNVIYNGHNCFFDQQNSGGTATIGRLTLTVEWHFKTPLWYSSFVQTGPGLNPPN